MIDVAVVTTVTRLATEPSAKGSCAVANPAGYYLNVHTQTFLDGAVRGQL